MRLLFLRNGYKVDWGAVSEDELLQAMVDSIYETARLEDVLNRCLQRTDDSMRLQQLFLGNAIR